MPGKQKVVVIGAGPVGALAAIYAAQRGNDVEVYELRGDLRNPSTTPLNFTKSINLALSERGINAMRNANRPGLLEAVMADTIPMRGRMIHGKKPDGSLYEDAQDYDIHGRTIFAVDRGGLNKTLLDELESMPNVKIYFNHKLVGADFKKKQAWFEQYEYPLDKNARPKEMELNFDMLIGADGAHSAVRYHLMKFARMDYQQEYIDTLWCEFHIDPVENYDKSQPDVKFAISQHHLHIWPGKERMFIAIPSLDGSFTCTLFMPSGQYNSLSANPSNIPDFFSTYFPGVTDLIATKALITSFQENPHLPLISIKCHPYHFNSSAVILGDAAHAMVPFYGQGMNAGLEDVRVLFEALDSHPQSIADALSAYSTQRAPDAAAINDLAFQNYAEMRSSVTSSIYLLRKHMEEYLSVYVPSLGWATKYSRVSFGNERYSEVMKKSDRQGRLLIRCFEAVTAATLVTSGLLIGWKFTNSIRGNRWISIPLGGVLGLKEFGFWVKSTSAGR